MHFVVVSFLFLSRLLVCEQLSVTFSTPEGACEQVGFTNEGRTRRVRMITLCLSELVLEIGHATPPFQLIDNPSIRTRSYAKSP